MSGLDLAIIWANLLGALLACLVNVLAGMSSPRDWRALRYSVAMLAAIYAFGYVLLLTGALGFEVWSRVFRGISPFAWLIVWAGPPLKASQMWRQFDSAVDQIKHPEAVR